VGVPLTEAQAAGFEAAIANRLATIVIVAIGAGYYMMARSDISRALGRQEPPPIGEQPSGGGS
jgi:hypothetical protein